MRWLFLLLCLILSSGVNMAAMAQGLMNSGPEMHPSPYVKWNGAIVGGDPQQRPLTREEAKPFYIKQYKVGPKEYFNATALVLSAKTYRYNDGTHTSLLAPVDLALGWEAMSDPNVLQHMYIGQKNRWYYFRYSGNSPVREDMIYRHSGNMHMIPANKDIAKALKSIERGDVVNIQGYLVNVHSGNGWRWVSSVSREDRGDSSCEVIYVKSVQILKKGIQWKQHHKKPSVLR